jgi:hypothetical protein
MSLGRKSKIIIVASLTILIIVFVISPISYLVINGFITKNEYSRANQPDLYIVPVEKKIADIENKTQDNVKINLANLEIKLPCKKIIKRLDDEILGEPQTVIFIDKSVDKAIFNKFISIGMLIKSEHGKGYSFEMYNKILYMTPDEINFFSITYKDGAKFPLIISKPLNLFSITKNNNEKFLLLYRKPIALFSRGSIYKFETSDVRGFQFINPNTKDKYVKVHIFDKNDNLYELTFGRFSQKEIDYTLASIRWNN